MIRQLLMRAIFPEIVFLFVLFAAFPPALAAGPPSEIGNDGLLSWNKRALARLHSPPLGLPSVPVPSDNAVTIDKIALGRKLFFDRRLSLTNTMSCAMCHIPEQGFTNNELSRPIGVEGRSLRRNAPTILNAAYAARVFLDGREVSLERQAVLPLLAHDEMANPSADVLVAKVAGLEDYEGLFEKAFGGGASLEFIGQAIASWERTLLAADSPFDRWRYGGETEALTPQQKQGFELFVGRGGCAKCHTVGPEYALFADQQFHDTGIGYLHDDIDGQHHAPVRVEVAPDVFLWVDYEVVQHVGRPRPNDQGRFEVTRDPTDRWRFKTPTLRNVAVTAPYMHDGSLRDLEAVVRFYNRGGAPHPGLDPLIEPLGLDASEIDAMVTFLHSLTAGNLSVLVADARSVAVGN